MSLVKVKIALDYGWWAVIGVAHTMRFIAYIVALLLTVSALSCRPVSKPVATANHRPNGLGAAVWNMARNASLKAEASSDKQAKAKAAKEGIAIAEECIMKFPEKAACYYYHAINTGLYYEAHVTGYQNGLKVMIYDCEKVIKLDDRFDHGGAYRMLGKIYTDVPETTLIKNGVMRDLDKAITYLQKAVQIGPDYPENNIYLAHALMESGLKKEASAYIANSRAALPQWKNHPDYAMWQKMNKELINKLQ